MAKNVGLSRERPYRSLGAAGNLPRAAELYVTQSSWKHKQ